MSLNRIVLSVREAGDHSLSVYHDEYMNAQALFDAWAFLKHLEDLGYTITPFVDDRP